MIRQLCLHENKSPIDTVGDTIEFIDDSQAFLQTPAVAQKIKSILLYFSTTKEQCQSFRYNYFSKILEIPTDSRYQDQPPPPFGVIRIRSYIK